MQPSSMFTDAQIARMLRRERKKRGLPPYAAASSTEPTKRTESLTAAQDLDLRAFIREATDKNPGISNPKIRAAYIKKTGTRVTDEMVRWRRNDMGIPAAPQRGRDRE